MEHSSTRIPRRLKKQGNIYRENTRSKRREKRLKSRELSENITEKYKMKNAFNCWEYYCADRAPVYYCVDYVWENPNLTCLNPECIEQMNNAWRSLLIYEEGEREEGIRRREEREFQEMAMYVKG